MLQHQNSKYGGKKHVIELQKRQVPQKFSILNLFGSKISSSNKIQYDIQKVRVVANSVPNKHKKVRNIFRHFRTSFSQMQTGV